LIQQIIFGSIKKQHYPIKNSLIMKGELLAGFAGIALLLTICVAANGQLSGSGFEPRGKIVFFDRSVSKSAPGLDATVNVNRRAVKDLERRFKNAFTENWYKVPDGFVADFALYDIRHQVAYDKKGNWLYTIRNYDETNLPADIRHLVKSTYYDYNIFLVHEIEKPSHSLTYIIHLEGKTSWINLRVFDGELEEWQKFKKSE